MALVSPSILSADFVNLQRDISHLEACGADYLHVDVMDGVFVPNITIGIPVVAAIRKITDLPLDVHLMITEPIRYVDAFCDAGADLLTIHLESDTKANTEAALRQIRSRGVKASLSIRPGTPVEELDPFLDLCDMILIMTVEPGFGGQAFQPAMLKKLRYLRSRCGIDLEVDGGVNEETGKLCVEAGANVLAAGSAAFRAPDTRAFISTLQHFSRNP